MQEDQEEQPTGPWAPPAGPQGAGEGRVYTWPVEACVSFLSSRGWCLLQPRGGQGRGSNISYLPSMTSRSFLLLVVPVSLFMGWVPPCVCLTEVGCKHLYLVEPTCEAHPSSCSPSCPGVVGMLYQPKIPSSRNVP